MSIDRNDLPGLAGATVIGADGNKIGDVSQFYLSDKTGEPTWATVKTGLFGTQESFVPLRGSSQQSGALHVAFDKATVKDAPRVDADSHLTPEEENDLYRFYGMTDDEDGDVRRPQQSDEAALGRSGTVGDTDHDADSDRDPDRDREVSPADERDRGEAQDRDADRDPDLDAVAPGETRTRMRRYVVTEHVTQTVEELPDDDRT